MSQAKRRINWDNIKGLLVSLIYVATLTGVILFLCESTEAPYQTWKDIESSKALLCFVIFMFTIQRVRLLNWQSLVVSVVYWIPAIWYLMTYRYGADIEAKDRIMAFVVWIMLLIITDMIVYQKHNKLSDFHGPSLFIYALMAVSLIAFRHNRTYPLALAGPFFLLYFIPISIKEWDRIMRQFINAWFIGFVVIMVRSFVENPYAEAVELTYGRYYGCFVDIGTFGTFMGCVFVTAIYAIYYYKDKGGRKSVGYIASWVWFVATLGAVWIIGTRTLLVGIACTLVVMYLFVRKDLSRKAIGKRVLKVLLAAVCACILFAVVAIIARQIDLTKLTETNVVAFIKKPLIFTIGSIQYFFSGSDLFLSGAFMDQPVLKFLDLLTSGRLQIAVEFAKQFSLSGNESITIMVGDYPALNAHNEYVQMIYEYGYIGGGCFIVWLLYNTWNQGALYNKESDAGRYLLPMLWMPMVVGLLLGERLHFYYPALFMTILVLYPSMTNLTKTHVDNEDSPHITKSIVMNYKSRERRRK